MKHWASLCALLALMSAGGCHSESVTTSELFDHCPNYCTCDLFNGRNRADCSFKRLINPAVEVAASVEILDISYNDFTNLDDNCFQNYRELIHLSLAHNAIHTIYLDAFSNLERIVSIDLSFNRLETLDERLIEGNRFLAMLNLEGNRFMSLENKPFLRSTSLKVLNLRNAQLNFIPRATFSGLPQLQRLDISQNLLITLNVETFYAMQHLQFIDLDQNRWQCDHSLQEVLRMLRRRAITVDSGDCQQRRESHKPPPEGEKKFERMKMYNSEDELDDKEVEVNVRIDNKSSEDSISDHFAMTGNCNDTLALVHEKYKTCLEGMQLLLKASNSLKKLTAEPTYSEDDLILALLMGVAIGMSTVVIAIALALCHRAIWKWSHKSRMATPPRQSDPMAEPLEAPIAAMSQRRIPPAPPVRRTPRRSNPSRTIIRYDIANQAPTNNNFIARLFGHPARHQYYRTLNQNTATLIRRLSQSNLFNNRLSRNLSTERQPSSSPASDDAGFFDNADMPSAPPRATPKARSTTPPPSYNDAVLSVEHSNEGRYTFSTLH